MEATRHALLIWSNEKAAASVAERVLCGTHKDAHVEDIGHVAHLQSSRLGCLPALLHPYLHSTDSNGKTLRGTSTVLAMLRKRPSLQSGHSPSNCAMSRYTAGEPDVRCIASAYGYSQRPAGYAGSKADISKQRMRTQNYQIG